MDRAEIILHDRKENGECMADIILPESGMQVNDLKVMKGTGGGVQVHMPPWMHTRWNYPEIQWSEVRRLVTAKYQQESRDRECLAENSRKTGRRYPQQIRYSRFTELIC